MNIEIIQQSIVDKLSNDFTASSLTFGAFNLPDTQSGYDDAMKTVPNSAAAFVVYSGSVADPMVTTNPVAQKRRLNFTVECHSRKLYGLTGMYVLRDWIEKILLGFRPTNADRLYLIKDEITKTEDGVWVHAFQFECVAMLVQTDITDPVIAGSGPFKGVAFND